MLPCFAPAKVQCRSATVQNRRIWLKILAGVFSAKIWIAAPFNQHQEVADALAAKRKKGYELILQTSALPATNHRPHGPIEIPSSLVAFRSHSRPPAHHG